MLDPIWVKTYCQLFMFIEFNSLLALLGEKRAQKPEGDPNCGLKLDSVKRHLMALLGEKGLKNLRADPNCGLKLDSVKRHLSRRHLSVLNLLFNSILDDGCTCEERRTLAEAASILAQQQSENTGLRLFD